MRLRPAGERSLLVELDEPEGVHRLWSALRNEPPPGAQDVVAGATTVLVILTPGTDRGRAAAAIQATADHRELPAMVRELTIAVVYDGPDLPGLAEQAGMSEADVVSLHAGATYTVAFLGFSPGFAYLAGLPAPLHVPRLATPRTSVPAGSVAVAAGMTAVYPNATPGGWRLIGRSDAVMFDPARASPALLEPGDRVRFRPVESAGPPRTAELSAALLDPASSTPYLLILDPGPLSTIQDRGRPGWAHVGVPGAGAADRAAAEGANHLVGNDAGAAVIEATLAGPTLRLGADRLVAVTGARAEIRVDGIPARQDAPLHLAAGAELAVGRFLSGTRVYVAVAGGIDVAPILGSRAADTLSGLGPRPLRPGDRLPLGPPVPPGPPPGRTILPDGGGQDGEPVTIRAWLGPRDDWVGTAGLRTLAGAEFTVSGESDRSGLRLSGPVIAVANPSQLPSEGTPPGAIQIPPDGQPIVFLRNGPTTGGYPVAAVVTETAIDRLAQARPGTRLRFELSLLS